MPSRPKRPADFAQRAKLIVDIATGQAPPDAPIPPESPRAIVRRKGGLKGGLTSVEIAGKLGISMQSLPPLVLGLRRKARLMGMDIDEFFVRERSFDQGKPISRYRLTEEGKKKLAS